MKEKVLFVHCEEKVHDRNQSILINHCCCVVDVVVVAVDVVVVTVSGRHVISVQGFWKKRETYQDGGKLRFCIGKVTLHNID